MYAGQRALRALRVGTIASVLGLIALIFYCRVRGKCIGDDPNERGSATSVLVSSTSLYIILVMHRRGGAVGRLDSKCHPGLITRSDVFQCSCSCFRAVLSFLAAGEAWSGRVCRSRFEGCTRGACWRCGRCWTALKQVPQRLGDSIRCLGARGK